MLTSKYIAVFILSLCVFFPHKLFSQANGIITDSTSFVTRINSIQIADYKPKKGKRGKNGVGRITIRILKSGRRGNDGKAGQDGPALHVTIMQANLYGQPVVQVAVHAADNTVNDTFYVNPKKGQLKIIADGADGGDGGEGEDETDSNSSATGGNGGNGGNGGSIEVSIVQADKGISGYGWLILSNMGGNGGRGGAGGKSLDSRFGGSSDGTNGAAGMMGSQTFNK